MTDYEKFVNDRGWEFDNDVLLKAAWERSCKSKNNTLLTEDEFLIEAKREGNKASRDVYAILVDMVNSGKLEARMVYMYARFCWCLEDAAAIVAYEVERGKWSVNNCDTQISIERAVVEVNTEWGFEASRIKIIGTPYYDATDYQYIRFDCAHMTWLWSNGSLYQVYA